MSVFTKLRYLLSRRDKKLLIVLLFASIFVSFLETFSVSVIMLFASVATNFDLVYSNKYYGYIYRLLNFSTPSQFVVALGLGLIVFFVFRGTIISLFTYAQSRFSQGRFKYFAFKFFRNYLNFHYKDFALNNSSKINKVIFTDSSQLTQIISSSLIIFAEVLTVLFIYVSLLWVNWKMTAVMTVLLGVKIFFIVKFFSGKLARAGRRNQEVSIEISKTFGESFWNFKLIKLLSNEKAILRRFDKATSGYAKANTLNMMLQNLPRMLIETIGFSLLIAAIVYVVYMYHTATHIIPVISMYAFAFYRFLPSVNKIMTGYNQILFCRHALDSVSEYLAYELEELGNKQIEFHEQIELRDVVFGYTDKEKILNGVSLIIPKGKRVAFIGASGGGKSTIVDVLMGLYKIKSGSISIDNKEINKDNVKSWRNKIGYIPQQIYLFDGTVAQNIIFGREYDEQKLIQVLKKANIYDFLQTKDGINTKVGEGGVLFSGGQKQRIAIARALYSDPAILVLDEATSALDNATEQKIMNEVYNLNKDKTLIIVAHRLTTVERCDTIFKMENGKVEVVDDLYAWYQETKISKDQQQQV